MICSRCEKEVKFTAVIGVAYYGRNSPHICDECRKKWIKIYHEKVKDSHEDNWKEVFEEWMGQAKIKVVFT